MHTPLKRPFAGSKIIFVRLNEGGGARCSIVVIGRGGGSGGISVSAWAPRGQRRHSVALNEIFMEAVTLDVRLQR